MKKFAGLAMAIAAASVIASPFAGVADSVFPTPEPRRRKRWEKTHEPAPDHEGHLRRAEEKRKRKAAALQKLPSKLLKDRPLQPGEY